MDEKRLRQALHDIAEQEINDDMNLLPEIMAQLNTGTPRARKGLWRSGRTRCCRKALLLMSGRRSTRCTASSWAIPVWTPRVKPTSSPNWLLKP
ncbi:MAG: hypothetical protein U0694_02980 [Anaerolineae bacterium]